MTVRNGEFITDDADEIEERIRSSLRTEFGDDIDLTDGSVFSTLARAYAEVLAGEIQQDLADVFDASFIDSAEGLNLEKVVSIIGLERRSPIRATGVVTFDAEQRVTSNVSIGSGTTVQTDGDDSISYDTTESVVINFYDSFEGATYPNDWSGDTGQFQRDTVFATDGSNSLKSPGGSVGDITYDGVLHDRGTTFECDIYFESGGSNPDKGGITYLVENKGDGGATGYSARVDASNNELELWSPAGEQVNTSATIPKDEVLTLRVTSKVNGDHIGKVFDSNDNLLAETSWTETDKQLRDQHATGYVGLIANNGEVSFDFLAERSVTADIRAAEGGEKGNIARNRITVMSSPVSGVQSLTNRVPVGDQSYRDTDSDRFTPGRNEETDEELRERAKIRSGGGGAATVDQLLSAVDTIEGVSSVSIFVNPTDSTSNGLPPHSFEMVVNGGDSFDIAEAIFDTQAATARDVSGVNGTAVTETVDAINGQSFTVEYSRPTVVSVDMTLDIVHDDTYEGDKALRDAVIDYIGGVDTDGVSVTGTDTGEDVRINEVEDRVMDIQGVRGIDAGGSSYTPSTTTDSNGLEVISISSNEVAETDGTDGSIVINKTQV